MTTDPKEIIITVTHQNKTEFGGFYSFWSWHVKGCKETTHCQGCLNPRKGKEWSIETKDGKVKRVSKSLFALDVPFHTEMKGDYYYICGVRSNASEHYNDNFHFAVQWEEGTTAELTTYNGFTFTIQNAKRIIFGKDAMKAQKYKHVEKNKKNIKEGLLDDSYLTCRIFWFIHKVYGKEIKDRRTGKVTPKKTKK